MVSGLKNVTNVNRSCLGDGTSGRAEDIREGCRKVNVVAKLCIHVLKWKKM
jgi:hypothetical protein